MPCAPADARSRSSGGAAMRTRQTRRSAPARASAPPRCRDARLGRALPGDLWIRTSPCGQVHRCGRRPDHRRPVASRPRPDSWPQAPPVGRLPNDSWSRWRAMCVFHGTEPQMGRRRPESIDADGSGCATTPAPRAADIARGTSIAPSREYQRTTMGTKMTMSNKRPWLATTCSRCSRPSRDA